MTHDPEHDTEHDLDRIRTALATTDDERDANRLRVDLLLAREADAHQSGAARRAGRPTALVIVAAALVAVVAGAGLLRAGLTHVEPVTAIPAASPPSQPGSLPPLVGDATGAAMLSKLQVRLSQTRLTATISTRDTTTTPGVPEAAVMHSPGYRLIRVRSGDLTYVNQGSGDDPRQLLLDDRQRRVWTAGPKDQTLAARIELAELDPLVKLIAAGRSRAPATVSHQTRSGRSLLTIDDDGSRLECALDDDTSLPISCRATGGGTPPTRTSTLTWQARDLTELETTLTVDTRNGYTWVKVV